jgi:hypothetical protein
VGGNNGGTITNSSAFGRVSLTAGDPFVGGFVGADNGGTYSGDTFNSGTTAQSNGAGGGASIPGISNTTETNPAPDQGPPPPPTSPLQTAATARATARTLAQQATNQEAAFAQAQIGAGAANVSANTGTAMTASTGADTGAASAGAGGAGGTRSGGRAIIDSNIEYEGAPTNSDERKRRRTASNHQNNHGNNLGATIRTIEINGRPFRLRGGAPDNGTTPPRNGNPQP